MAYPSVTNSNASNSGADITSGANWTFSFGFTATSGRLLILLATADANTTLTASGFTQVAASNNFSAVRFHVFRKISDGTETSVDISPNATESISAIIYEISGHNGTSGIANSTVATGTSTSPNPDSVSNFNSGEETLFIACYGFDGQSTRQNNGYPTGYDSNQRTSAWSNAAGVGVAGATKNSTAASEDPSAFTLSASDEWVAYTVAIRSDQSATGTVAVTLGGVTSSASGTESMTGTVAVTLSGVTSSASGTVTSASTSNGFLLSQHLSAPLADSLSFGG